MAVRERPPSMTYRPPPWDKALLQIDAGHAPVGVTIRQHTNRVKHVPTAEELDRQRRSSWPPQKYDYIPNERLYIVLLSGTSRNWDGLPDNPLESRLQEIVEEIQRCSHDALARERAVEQRNEERAREWDDARDRAVQMHATETKMRVLDEQFRQWRELAELDSFIRAMAARVEVYKPGLERQAAEEWLAWVRRHRENLDPFRSLKMPTDVRPTPDDLAPYMGGLSPYGPPRSW